MSSLTASRFDTSKHLALLDAVRGLAILLVLVFHLRGPIVTLSALPILAYPLHVLSPLWVGVDLFFVLSGFLITNILLRSRSSEHYFRNFYARRTLRIFPLFYFTLIVHQFLQWWCPAFGISQDAGFQRVWYWLYAQNWLGVLRDEALLGFEHYWSLAIEEQFYLVWPLVVFAIRSPKSGLRFCVALIGFCLLLRIFLVFIDAPPVALHYATVTRLDSLATGGVLAYASQLYSDERLVEAGRHVLLVGVAGFAICVLSDLRNPVYGNVAMQTVGYTFAALASAGGIAHALGTPDGRVSTVLRWRVLRWLGTYSYGLYVYHWPIVSVMDRVCARMAPPSLGLAGLFVVLSVVLTLVAAFISYRLLEMPFLRLKTVFASKAVRAPSTPAS